MESKYKIDNMSYSELESSVILPNFQRRLVWSKNQKKAFIETLSKGHPFGAILIYKYDSGQNSLIDGLQRFTTIKDYQNNPQNYIPSINIAEDKIFPLLFPEENAKSFRENTVKKINIVIKEYISFYSKNEHKFSEFVKIFETNLPDFKNKIDANFRELSKIIEEDLIQHIKNYVDVKQIKIPTIIFTGSVSELATVFENLNRGGKKLSKYQVFAAQWSSFLINLSDEDYNKKILELTIGMYKKLTDSREVKIENFDEEEMREKREINMSEFCYSVGKLILEQMHVFWKSDNDDLANQIGYSTVAITLGVRNKNLNDIIDYHDSFKDVNFVEDYIKSILSVYKDINDIFKKRFRVPGNDDIYFGGSTASDFQLLSYFGSLWKIKFDTIENSKMEIKPRYKTSYKQILENLFHYYIYDIVNGKWSGSGDTKLDRIVIDREESHLNIIEKDRLEQAILNWHEDVIQKGSLNFEKVSKMLYTVYISYYPDKFEQPKYDTEHIVPRYFLKKSQENPVPAGTLGNIMYLDTANNRSKQELSLYENLKPGQKLDDDYFNFQEYPSEKDLKKVRTELEAKTSYEFTTNLIYRRGKNIITSLINKLYENN